MDNQSPASEHPESSAGEEEKPVLPTPSPESVSGVPKVSKAGGGNKLILVIGAALLALLGVIAVFALGSGEKPQQSSAENQEPVKYVDLGNLGQPLDPNRLDAATKASLEQMTKDGLLSCEPLEGSGDKQELKSIRIEGSTDTFAFCIYRSLAAAGESDDITMYNVSLKVEMFSYFSDSSLSEGSGFSRVSSRYGMSGANELVDIERISVRSRSFKGKNTCTAIYEKFRIDKVSKKFSLKSKGNTGTVNCDALANESAMAKLFDGIR